MSSKENADYLMQQAQVAGVTDYKELANFMGQMQVESGGFKSMDENLHYSGERLLEVFSGRNGIDDLTKADKIAKRGQEAIANAVYGGEWGEKVLGNKQAGDGWKYHGRGYIQLTGHDRYAEAGAALGMDLLNKPELAADRENAAKIATWYWNALVVSRGNQESVDDTTYAINTGGKGLLERRAAAATWEQKLELGYVPGAPEPVLARTLKQGMGGDDVKVAQGELQNLGYPQADPDGRFGPLTEAAVKNFQRHQGLDMDGKIGPVTRQHLSAAMRDKQIADFTSASGSRLAPFADSSHPQSAMYSALKSMLPQGTSEARLAQGTAACHAAGITDPTDLFGVFVGDKSVLFVSKSTPVPAQIDISLPAPSVQVSARQMEQHGQQQAQMMDRHADSVDLYQQGPLPGGL